MRLQNNLWQAQQNCIAAGILVEAYSTTTKMARIERIDQHNERKRYPHNVT